MSTVEATPSAGAPGLSVVEIDPANDPRWDAYVARHPNALVYHHSGWLRSLALESGQRSIGLACLSASGDLAGILPLSRTRGLPFGLGTGAAGPRLSSLPRTPVAGPLADDRAALVALVRSAADRARGAGLRLQIKSPGRDLDGIVDGLLGNQWRPSYVVALPEDPDQLRFGDSRNNATVRRSIRKAEREGIAIRPATDEGELRVWYRLHLDLNRWHAQPSRPYRFFEGLWRWLGPHGHVQLLLAEAPEGGGRQVVSGNLLLMFGDTVVYAFNGRRRDALASRPNELLHWHAMREAATAGYRRYDLGEVEEHNAGLARFKAKWGADVEFTHRYYAPPLVEDGAGYGSLESTGRLRAAATTIWRHVPLPLTAFVGAQVNRLL